jgi:hypothetical protein
MPLEIVTRLKIIFLAAMLPLQQLVYPQNNPGFTTSSEIIFPNDLSLIFRE